MLSSIYFFLFIILGKEIGRSWPNLTRAKLKSLVGQMQSFTAKGAESELELMKSCTSPILPQTPTSHPNALEERKNQRFFLLKVALKDFPLVLRNFESSYVGASLSSSNPRSWISESFVLGLFCMTLFLASRGPHRAIAPTWLEWSVWITLSPFQKPCIWDYIHNSLEILLTKV